MTDFKLSWKFITDVEPAFGCSHCVEVGLLPMFQRILLIACIIWAEVGRSGSSWFTLGYGHVN
jgi:hypothetical protein